MYIAVNKTTLMYLGNVLINEYRFGTKKITVSFLCYLSIK